MSIRPLIAVGVAALLVPVTPAVAASKADQMRNTVSAIHRLVQNLERNLSSSVERLNETSAELLTRVDASDQSTRRLLSVVEENQMKLDLMQRRLDDLVTTLYKHLDLSPPTQLAAGPTSTTPPPPVEDSLEVRSGEIRVQAPTVEAAPELRTPVLPQAEIFEPPSSEEADSYYIRARGLYTEGNYRGALEQFDSYARLFPDSPNAGFAQYWKALCHLRLDEYEMAIREFGVLLRDYPTSGKVPLAMHNQAVAYSYNGQNNEAKATFEKLIQQYPDDVVADLARDKLRQLQDFN